MTSVALPLIVREFHIGAAEKGIVSAASLFGILIGAVLLGGLSDYFGRKPRWTAATRSNIWTPCSSFRYRILSAR
jgi:MFS transporter, putative metabolite transport protein